MKMLDYNDPFIYVFNHELLDSLDNVREKYTLFYTRSSPMSNNDKYLRSQITLYITKITDNKIMVEYTPYGFRQHYTKKYDLKYRIFPFISYYLNIRLIIYVS